MAHAAAPSENRGFVNSMLDTIEKVGKKFPSPVTMFLYLIIGVIVLSAWATPDSARYPCWSGSY